MTESVYRFYDTADRLLYVGVTKRGSERFDEHASSKRWWKLVCRSEVEHHPTREAALKRERFLIETFRPRYNVQHNEREVVRTVIAVSAVDPYWGDAPVKERRSRWYALPREERDAAPCVICGGGHEGQGPSCPACYAVTRGV